eukprot:558797-Rhodomonas_salina.3
MTTRGGELPWYPGTGGGTRVTTLLPVLLLLGAPVDHQCELRCTFLTTCGELHVIRTRDAVKYMWCLADTFVRYSNMYEQDATE